MPNLLVPLCVLRLSRTEVPSLRRRYPASAVLRTSPPPQGARPVPRGRPVGRPRPHLGASRVACAFLVYMLLPLPRCSAWAYSSLMHPDLSAFPERVVGSACTSSFSRLARHSLALRPAHSRCHQCVTRYTEGFSHFVTSMTAPVASGWSDGRVGLAPTGKAPSYHGAHPKRTLARKKPGPLFRGCSTNYPSRDCLRRTFQRQNRQTRGPWPADDGALERQRKKSATACCIDRASG